MLWASRRISASRPLPALLLFILIWIQSSPDKCMASPFLFSWNLLSNPRPSPFAPTGSSGTGGDRPRVWLLAGLANGSWDSWGWLLSCAGSYPNVQPISNTVVPSDGKRVCARQREAGRNLQYPSLSSRCVWHHVLCIHWISCWQSCSWRHLSCSRVPGGQGWKYFRQALPSACQGEEVEKKFVRHQEGSWCLICITNLEKSNTGVFKEVLRRGF